MPITSKLDREFKLDPVSEQPISDVKYTRTAIVAAAIVTIIVLCSVAYSPPLGLKLKEGILQQLGSMFGFLLMVSLFVERALEVVISIWSDPEADRLEQELETLAEARSRQSDRIDHLLTEQAQMPEPSSERLTAIRNELEVLREKMRREQDRDDAIDGSGANVTKCMLCLASRLAINGFHVSRNSKLEGRFVGRRLFAYAPTDACCRVLPLNR
jgi:hypothetical protein